MSQHHECHKALTYMLTPLHIYGLQKHENVVFSIPNSKNNEYIHNCTKYEFFIFTISMWSKYSYKLIKKDEVFE